MTVQLLRELAPAAAGLLVNLLLFGSAILVVLAVALRFARGGLPRTRYAVAVTAFLLAVMMPAVATFRRPDAPTERLVFDDVPLSGGTKGMQWTMDAAVSWSDRTPLAAIVAGVWAAVALLLITREVTGHAMMLARRRTWTPASGVVRKELGWPEDVRLFLADGDGPATVGFLRPVVVLPREWMGALKESVAASVARHELAHARWRDPLANALLRLVRAALWPSVPLWALERIVRLERESAADAVAVGSGAERTGDAAAYATALVGAAVHAKQLRHVTGLGNGIGLEARIKRLFQQHPGKGRIVAAASLLAAGGLLLAAIPAVVPARPPLPRFRADAGPAYDITAKAVSSILFGTRPRNHDATPEVLRGLATIRAAGSIDPILEALAAPDRRTREATAWVAGELGDARLTDALISRLRDDDPHVQHTAAWALGMIGDRRAIVDLVAALADRNADARAGSAWALGRMRAAQAVEPLIAQLHDSDADAQKAAAWALGRILNPK